MADPFAAIRKAGTCAPNFDLDTEAIIEHLTQWQALGSFSVTDAGPATVNLEIKTLPDDMDAFVQDLYGFCPDLVDQGTICVPEILEAMEAQGKEPTPEMLKLIEGVDFGDENYGLEILKREIRREMKIRLWWD